MPSKLFYKSWIEPCAVRYMRYHPNIDDLSLNSCYCCHFTFVAITSERLVFPGLALNTALYTSAEHVYQ